MERGEEERRVGRLQSGRGRGREKGRGSEGGKTRCGGGPRRPRSERLGVGWLARVGGRGGEQSAWDGDKHLPEHSAADSHHLEEVRALHTLVRG